MCTQRVDTGREIISDGFSIAFNYENEWPLRVVELIADLSEWYAGYPSVTQESSVGIATFLDNVLSDEGLIHDLGCVTIEPSVASQAFHTVKLSIDFSALCSTLAKLAFERYVLPNLIRSHVAV